MTDHPKHNQSFCPEKKYKNGRKIYRDPFIIWKTGKLMNVDVKTTVLNVFVKLQIENPSMTTKELSAACCDLTGVSESAIAMLWREYREKGKFTTPLRKRHCRNAGTATSTVEISRHSMKCHDSILCAVREIAYGFFRRGEMPTLNKILAVIEGDPSVDLPIMEISTLDRVLKDIGFVNLVSGKCRQPNSLLVEKDDIVLWRRKYLREIKEIRKSKRKIYYLDEVSIDVRPNSTSENHNAKYPSGSLEIAPENPAKTFSRVIIMHAGSADGFVAGAATIFLAENGGELIDGSFFETWFEEKLLPNIQPNSAIVLDNAWYHSLKVESLPTVFWRRCEIENWLAEKNVTWNSEQLKPELLQLTERYAQKCTYRVDQIAERYGHKVLCLPPLHGSLNPIEEVWLLINKYVATWKQAVNMLEAKKLIEEAISEIKPTQWTTFESTVIAKETEMWDMAELIEDMVDSALVSNRGCSSSESDDEGPYFKDELMTELGEADT